MPMTTSRGRDWLTTGEVAVRLGYSIPWVREQIRLGRLPARQYMHAQRRSLRVHVGDLERFTDRWMKDAND